jgi:hypothetical protein
MSIQSVSGSDIRYYLIAYDKDGRERIDDPDGVNGKLSERVASAVRSDPVTDVFVMSHGWMGDIPAAIEQYDRWTKAMAGCEADLKELREARPGFNPLVVGFHWPSLPWGVEQFGAGAPAFAAPAAPGAGQTTLDAALDSMVDSGADRLVDTPRAREAIREILASAMNAGPGLTTLPPEVSAAYRTLNEELGLGADGPAGNPGADREPFDPDRAFKNARLAATAVPRGASPFAGFGLPMLLSPLQQLSFWTMKDRGRKIGEAAGASLLRTLMAAVPNGRHARFHLMGHSFGTIVVSAMAQQARAAGGLAQPIKSLALVQGATSIWGFCNNIPDAGGAGYFRKLVEEQAVSGPILTTQSKFDTAVGRLYPMAAGVALQVAFPVGQFPKYAGLGAFGIQGPGLTLQDLAVGEAHHKYEFQSGQVYNLECSNVINQGGGLSGAHSDIAKPEVAHAIWEAVKAA